MTEVQTFTLEASGSQSIRLGINWTPLLRDKLEGNRAYSPSKDNLKRVIRLRAGMATLWIFALLFRITLILWPLATKLDAYRWKLGLRLKNLYTYLSQKDLPSYDLDLCCFCYAGGKLVGSVLPSRTEMFGKVGWLEFFNHSGDDVTGIGDIFDEELIVKLKAIDERIDRLFFVILSKNHGFNRIKDGTWALFDTTHETQLTSRSLKTQSANRGYVMAEASRKNGNWVIIEILEFFPVADNETPVHESVDRVLQKYLNTLQNLK